MHINIHKNIHAHMHTIQHNHYGDEIKVYVCTETSKSFGTEFAVASMAAMVTPASSWKRKK